MNVSAHIDDYRSTASCSVDLKAHLIPLAGVNTATSRPKTTSPLLLLPRVTFQDVRII